VKLRDDLRTRLAEECLRHALRFPEVFQTYRECYRSAPTPDCLRTRQHERLAALLSEVLGTVPALRVLGVRWTHDADPEAVLASLPTMRKSQIIAKPADHVADRFDAARCVAARTSGTTGEPLRIIHSHSHLIHASASELGRLMRAGAPLDRKTLLPFKMGGQGWHEYTMVTTGFNRIAEFGFLDGYGGAYRRQVMRRCVQFAPDVVFSHPTRCVALVQLLVEAGVSELPVGQVRTFGEKLTSPVRHLLAEFFGGEVRDSYGMNEVNTIAVECHAGQLHVDEDRLWIEILDQDGASVPCGEPGEITVTSFFNNVMPFVRYRTGDIGALAEAGCGCGNPSRVLRLLAGRAHAAIQLPDGGTIDSLRAIRALEPFPVRQFQVVQRDVHELTVLVTPLTPAHPVADWCDRAATAVRTAVDGRLSVRIVLAGPNDYHRPSAEKVTSFVSLLPTSPTTSSTEGGVCGDEKRADRQCPEA
jgi:phenylacetate-CoA ligase